MKCYRVLIATFAVAATACALAQSPSQILVLQEPVANQTLPVQRAEGILSVHYDGRLSATRAIWVRVFRDSLNDLTTKYPSETPQGKCVIYAHAARFHVDHGFDRELRISDLVSFFQAALFQERQTLTLVFEEGDDPDSNGPLRLEKNAIADYFRNAVVMPLIAPDEMKKQWDQEAVQLDAHRDDRGFLERMFGPKKVYASERSPQPASTPIVVPVKISPPCQKLKILPYVSLPLNASMNSKTQEALAPFGIRENQECGE